MDSGSPTWKSRHTNQRRHGCRINGTSPSRVGPRPPSQLNPKSGIDGQGIPGFSCIEIAYSDLPNFPNLIMSKDSKIEWTHHTFNPWWGCTKVSEACTYCYAESWAKRLGSDIWGTRNQRRLFGETHWQQPITWNREAEREGKRKRVFCASMADVFENRPELVAPRTRLWAMIESTPWLDWLLLTKSLS